MRKLAIIHFNPIELYPPVMNVLDYFSSSDIRFLVEVYTMAPPAGMNVYTPASPNITVFRYGKSTSGMGPLKRYYNYLLYYTATCFRCLKYKPGIILTYETLSFLPAWLYKKFSADKPAIMIHYHEYMTPEEVNSSMKLNKWLHRLEVNTYPSTSWISHTNAERMQKFVDDHAGVTLPHTYLLPNYPSEKWRRTPIASTGEPVKIIYVGSLSLETMFTREFADWIIGQRGKAVWHIYSNNLSAEVISYLKDLGTPFIEYKGACEYHLLPDLLQQYNAGVVLYKGHIPNYIYNAPNKLFEYLACGLDVWVPDVMTGCVPYLTYDSWPKVLSLDFTSLGRDAKDLINRDGLSYKPSSFFYEKVLSMFLDKINSLFSVQQPAGKMLNG
jgi:hypothetical protein